MQIHTWHIIHNINECGLQIGDVDILLCCHSLFQVIVMDGSTQVFKNIARGVVVSSGL